jgi:hypothetical protein
LWSEASLGQKGAEGVTQVAECFPSKCKVLNGKEGWRKRGREEGGGREGARKEGEGKGRKEGGKDASK